MLGRTPFAARRDHQRRRVGGGDEEDHRQQRAEHRQRAGPREGIEEDVTDVLDYVQFKGDELAGRVAGFLIASVEKGTLTQEEADEYLALYKEGLNGYTYLVKPPREKS